MDAVEFLRALRRRWVVLAGAVGIALAVGWASTTVVEPGPPIRSYQARTVLLSTGQPAFGTSGVYNLQTIARLATVGEVPDRVAESLGHEGDPLELAAQIRSFGDQDTGLLTITATSTDPREARVLANTFARELVSFLSESNSLTVNQEVREVQKDIRGLRSEIRQLDAQIAAASGSQIEILTAARDAKVQELSLAYQRSSSLATASTAPIDLQIIQDAVPVLLPEQGFIQVRSLPSRLILAALLGLLLGAGVVFLLERFDTRIRTKDEAERDFELPVLAEIPLVPKRRAREVGTMTATRPKSLTADAFRLLATGVFRRPPKPPQVILVTSPGPTEGKTTAVANLAVSFAEVGKRTLIISGDMHRPQVHRLLGVPNTQGLSDLLKEAAAAAGDGDARTLPQLLVDGHVWKTPFENVRVIPSGPTPENPAELLASEAMRQLLREAREAADVVLIDTPPILAVSDATALLPETDAVVLVGRVGITTTEAAKRTTEMLLRLGAPVVGVALNAVSEVVLPRSYYQYYRPPEDRKRQGRSERSLTRTRRGF